MIKAPATYSASAILSLGGDATLTALLGWANHADTLALSLEEGSYGEDPAQAFADRSAHHQTICAIWCESRPFQAINHPMASKAIALIDRAILVEPFPALGF